MIDFFSHLFGFCSDNHSHLSFKDLFFSANEIRDKISLIKIFFVNLFKKKI